jgi:hypothetical protein
MIPIRLCINIVCVTILAASLAIIGWAILRERAGRTPFGTPDYAGFYVAAAILNRNLPERLYDQELQSALLHSLLPGTEPEVRYPFGHAPFVAFLLRPLARLPFRWSYPLWLFILAVIALAGFAVLRRAASGISPGDWATAFLVSLSFLPLIQECWLAGQLSIIGFFWVAVALWNLRPGKLFGCGAALAMCVYKPTLMIFALPVLVVAGQWRILAGFATGGAGLALLSLGAVGWSGCRSYLDMLTAYAHHSSAGSPGFKTFKHVDLNSFCTLLLGGPSAMARGVLVLAAATAILILRRAWRARSGRGDDNRLLAMCATLTWNSVINLYTPIYDLTLAIPGVLMTADVLYRRPRDVRHPLGPVFGMLIILLVVGAGVTQGLAHDYGFQPVTLVLLAMGTYQAVLAGRELPTERGSPWTENAL